jgi:hypothetical protein
MTRELDGHADEFGDYAVEMLKDLHASNISVWISWVADRSIEVKLGGQVESGVPKEHVFDDLGYALQWISDTACELYPDSEFATKYEPRYQSPYEPGSPEARAAGCICPDGYTTEDGYRHSTHRCPEHGHGSRRIIRGELIFVDDNWRPDRPRIG